MAPSESTKADYKDESVRDVQILMDMMSGKAPDFTRTVALAQDRPYQCTQPTSKPLPN